MRLILLLLFLLPLYLKAQFTITGSVLGGDDRVKLAGASIFINNFSRGTLADSSGFFRLSLPAKGSYELVVSFVGYESMVYRLELVNPEMNFRFELKRKAVQLANVVVRNNKDESERNLGLFRKYFIGTTQNSGDCILVNPRSLYLEYNEDTKVLRATTDDEILIIENRALGYRISFLVSEFVLYERNNFVEYSGYASYEPMEPSGRRQLRIWKNNRKRAYLGSSMHLLRSLYQRNWENEGFEILKMRRIFAPGRMSDSLLQLNIDRLMSINQQQGWKVPPELKDSLDYYMRQQASPAYQEQLEGKFNYLQDLTQRGAELELSFNYFLRIYFYREFEEPEYVGTGRRVSSSQTSTMILIHRPVIIYPDGHLANPLSVLFDGYMGWEKMGDSLPFDYEPEME